MLCFIAAYGRLTCLAYPAPDGVWWVSLIHELGFEQLGPSADARDARRAAERHLGHCLGCPGHVQLHWSACPLLAALA